MKLAPHWKGPYKIVQVMDSCGELGLIYKIVNPLDSDERAQVVHYDRLRPYTLPIPSLSQNQTLENVFDSFPTSSSPEVDMPGREECVFPQSDLSVLPDKQCFDNKPEPNVSRTGRLLKPPVHLKNFVMY